MAAAVVAAVGLAVVGSLPGARPAGELSAAIVQVDPVCPGRGMVACPDQPERLRQAFLAASRDLPAGLDLVVWGEGALSGLPPQQAGAVVVGRLRRLPAPLLTGVTSPAGDGGFHNRNVVYDRQGGVIDACVKRHPVPFGEHVSVRGWLGDVGDVGRLVPRDLVAGDELGRLATPHGRLGTVSSWEVTFARHVRDAGLGGAQPGHGQQLIGDRVGAIARRWSSPPAPAS